MAKKHKSRGSAEAEKPPYMRLSFWLKENFWLTTYKDRPDIIDRYEKWLSKWASETRNIATLDPNLK